MISQVLFLLGGFLLLGVNCHENIQDPRTITPWTFVYTVQPYYQFEALVNLWKSEKNIKVPGEFLAWPSMDNRVPDKSNVNDTVSENQINSKQHQHDSIPSQHLDKQVMTEITYWPPRKSRDQRPPIVIPRYFDSV